MDAAKQVNTDLQAIHNERLPHNFPVHTPKGVRCVAPSCLWLLALCERSTRLHCVSTMVFAVVFVLCRGLSPGHAHSVAKTTLHHAPSVLGLRSVCVSNQL